MSARMTCTRAGRTRYWSGGPRSSSRRWLGVMRTIWRGRRNRKLIQANRIPKIAEDVQLSALENFMGYIVGVLSSATVVVLVYFAYWVSWNHSSRQRAYASCWWLPAWNCFRLVIENMDDGGNLTAIRYRTWIRRVHLASAGSTVNTFEDHVLESGERIILPAGQDVPVLCFRVENKNGHLMLILTDKRGNKIREIEIDEQVEAIFTEYSLRIQSWFLFKHEISRLFALPRQLTIDGKPRDIFKSHLLPLQGRGEARVKTVFQTANVISVSI